VRGGPLVVIGSDGHAARSVHVVGGRRVP
jgi:hypothetical protein